MSAHRAVFRVRGVATPPYFPMRAMMDGDALEQTQYIQRRAYTDSSIPPSPLDLHSASALGNYECVQEAISSKQDINRRNKGEQDGESCLVWLRPSVNCKGNCEREKKMASVLLLLPVPIQCKIICGYQHYYASLR